MADQRIPLPVWDHVYRAQIAASPYPWPVKSQVRLSEGHKFWLAISEEVLVNPSFARPIWKPRQSPNFIHVRVDRVDGELLLLSRI